MLRNRNRQFIYRLFRRSSSEALQTQQNKTMIKKDGLQTAAEERQAQSKEFRREVVRKSIPKRWTNNGKAPALGGSQPNPGHDQITLLSRTERPAARHTCMYTYRIPLHA